MSFSEGFSYTEVLKAEIAELNNQIEVLKKEVATYKDAWVEALRSNTVANKALRDTQERVMELNVELAKLRPGVRPKDA